MEILLKKEFFFLRKEWFVRGNNLEAMLIKYDSGICGVKLSNKYGYITVLPFNGQMIWDAVFNGRTLKMKTPFEQPKDVVSFLDTYGCYLMHCGALRMGCPGPEDNHPQHGELPYAHYDSASLIVGEDEKGNFIGVTGIYEYNRAFGDNYFAKPVVKLYENISIIDVSIKIENLSNYPMELMYMCHINNRAVAGGKIVQTVPWTKEHMELRYSIPNTVQVDNNFRVFLDRIQSNIQTTEQINEEDIYDPEVVFFIQKPNVDEEGWAHYMYIHPDGSADYTSYKPSELDHCARWIVRTKNKQALGLALPSTADAEGYLSEKRKGNIKSIPPKSSFETALKVGYIESKNVASIEQRINQINK